MIKTAIKKEIHQLVDKLPERDLHAAKRFLQYLASLKEREEDPVLKALKNAPWDDEPLTEEDIKALEEAHEDVKAGRIVSHEEAKRLLLGKKG